MTDSLEGFSESSFFEEVVQEVVAWPYQDTTEWFSRVVTMALADEASVVAKHLLGDRHLVTPLVEAIQTSTENPTLVIDAWASRFTETGRAALLNLRDLIYHMSGARIVNCESHLPQENYIDYDLADIRQARTRLSEDQVFWKLFIDTTLDSLNRYRIPYEAIDCLTFQDILSLRAPLLQSGFQKDYETLVSTVLSSAGTQASLLDLHELETIRARLLGRFREIVAIQLPDYFRRKRYQPVKTVFDSASSVALGLAGFIPGLGVLASLGSLLKDSRSLLFTLSAEAHTLSSDTDYFESRASLMRSALSRTEISDQSGFVEVVALMTRALTERQTL